MRSFCRLECYCILIMTYYYYYYHYKTMTEDSAHKKHCYLQCYICSIQSC